MRLRHWFLPDVPDVVGLLRDHLGVTIEGLEAFADWAAGDPAAAARVRDAEQRGDRAKRELVTVLRAALVTPVEPEDVFALSRSIEWILDFTHDVVAESEAMACAPDGPIAEMAVLLCDAARHLDAAVAGLAGDGDGATTAAEAALAAQRALDGPYLRGMSASLTFDDRGERISRRELYRRCVRIGEPVVDAAERVIYAVVKQG